MDSETSSLKQDEECHASVDEREEDGSHFKETTFVEPISSFDTSDFGKKCLVGLQGSSVTCSGKPVCNNKDDFTGNADHTSNHGYADNQCLEYDAKFAHPTEVSGSTISDSLKMPVLCSDSNGSKSQEREEHNKSMKVSELATNKALGEAKGRGALSIQDGYEKLKSDTSSISFDQSNGEEEDEEFKIEEAVVKELSSEDLHTHMLERVCRICAEMTVVFDGPKKGVPKVEMVPFVKKIWKVDISDEDPGRYPVNVCLQCERKIKRVYLKVAKKKKCKLFQSMPAEFKPHHDKDCSICKLKDTLNDRTIGDKRKEEISQEADSLDDATGSIETGVALEPRRNPARSRGWSDSEPSTKAVGCQTDWETDEGGATGLEEHDYYQEDKTDLQYLISPKKMSSRMPYHKQPLSSVNSKYIRQDRLKPLISHIDKFCRSHKENKVDVMFFLLMQALRDAGDRTRENSIVDIWTRKGSEGASLTEEECLAKRIMLKQTKEQYRKEYSYYKEKLEKSVLKPPFIIDRLEKTYFPEHLDYYITDSEEGSIIYRHEKQSYPSYFSISESLDDGSKSDGVTGVRWRYFDAVAKTLEELSHNLGNYMQDLGENSCIHVDMSDYCEEKKDTAYLADRNETSASGNKRGQSKMITYLFCIQSLQAVKDGTVNWTCGSGDVNVCRPIMKALVTDGSALRTSMLMIKEERDKMPGKIFHLTLQGGIPARFVIYFSNEAPEVRRDYRNTMGLSLSSFKKAPTVINRYGNLCLELKRGWLASSPRLSHVGKVTNLRTKCSRCGEQGHNVRKCSKASHDRVEGCNNIPNKRQKKLRAVSAGTYSTSLNDTSEAAVESQPSTIQLQQPVQQLKQDRHESLAPMATRSTGISLGSSATRNEDALMWACSDINGVPHVDAQHQNAQVLIPAPATDSDYQAGSNRTLVQVTQQGTQPPMYVLTYTVVQPMNGGGVQQQSVSHPVHQLTALHPQSTQQPHMQQQPMTVIHQQPSGHPSSSHHLQQQQLSVIHPQPPQQSLNIGHQHEAREPSTQEIQQLGVVHSSNSGSLQSVDSSHRLSLTHQQIATQPQQQGPLIHQHQMPQTSSTTTAATIVQQPSQSSHLHRQHPETSSPHESVPNSQSSELQPIIGQW